MFCHVSSRRVSIRFVSIRRGINHSIALSKKGKKEKGKGKNLTRRPNPDDLGV